MSAPLVIEHHLNGASGAATLTIASELMKNYVAASAIDAQQHLEVAQSASGDFIAFSIDDKGRLRVILRDPGGPTGYRQIDLGGPLGEGLVTQAFAVSQARDGTLTLAVAVGETRESPAALYIAGPIPNDLPMDSADLSRRWVRRDDPRGAAPVVRILIGTDDDRAGSPLIVVATRVAGVITYSLVDSDTKDPKGSWSPLPPPEDATELLDLDIGATILGRGIYTLYRVGAVTRLVFTSLPNPRTGNTFNIPLTPPPGAAVLASLPDPNDPKLSTLFVGGSGLHFFSSQNQRRDAQAAEIAGAEALPRVHELVVRQGAEVVAVWALDDAGVLSYVAGTHGDGGALQWTPPLKLRSDVAQIAALRNVISHANEVFIVDADSSLAYLVEDPGTSVLTETDLPLFSTGETLEIDTYTTHISLRGANLMPLPNANLLVNASKRTLTIINGRAHVIDDDPAEPVRVTTDFAGNVTIIQRVTTISTPSFRLRADFIDGAIDVDPAAKLMAGLRRVQSGDDLANAPTQDGKPLVTRQVDRATLDGAASAVKRLTDLADQVPAGGDDGSTQLLPGRTALGARLRAAGRDPHYCWGVTFGDQGARYIEGDTARDLQHGRRSFFAFAGDVLHALQSGLEEVRHFVVQLVDDALEFIVEIGGTLVKFVIEALEQVYLVIHWVLEKTLGIDLDRFIAWLGHLFGWDAIVATHRVLTNVTLAAADFIGANIAEAERAVTELFGELRRELPKLVGQSSPVGNRSTLAEYDDPRPAAPPRSQEADAFQRHSPAAHFGSYQLMHGGVARSVAPLVPVDPFEDLVNNVLEPLLGDVSKTLQSVVTDLLDLLRPGTATANELLAHLRIDVVSGVLKTIEDLVEGLLRVAADLLGVLRSTLDEPLEIPLLSGLYQRFVGEPFTLLRGLSLLIAVPTTLIIRLATGRAPFADGTFGLDGAGAARLFAAERAGGRGLLAAGDSGGRVGTLLVAAEPPPGEKPSIGELALSGVEGISFSASQLLAGLVGALVALDRGSDLEPIEGDTPEDLRNKVVQLERIEGGILLLNKIQVAATFINVGFGYPFFASEATKRMSLGVWALSVVDLLLNVPLLVAPRVVQGRNPSEETLAKFNGRLAVANRIVGGYQLLETIADLPLYTWIFAVELAESKDDEEIPWYIEKLIQNWLAAGGNGANGVSRFIPPSPTALEVLAVGSGLQGIAGVLNGIRLLARDLPNDILHLNF
jgi:hypothetical protein